MYVCITGNDVKGNMDKLVREAQTLETELSNVKYSLMKMEPELRAAIKQRDELRSENEELMKKLKEAKDESQNAHRTCIELEREIEQLKKEMKQKVRDFITKLKDFQCNSGIN